MARLAGAHSFVGGILKSSAHVSNSSAFQLRELSSDESQKIVPSVIDTSDERLFASKYTKKIIKKSRLLDTFSS